MGLSNNRSEGNYVKSYSIPSSCKDEKAHFDTSDHVHGKTEDKPRPEPKTQPKADVKPEPKPKPASDAKSKPEQKPTQNANQSPHPRPRPKTGLGVPPNEHKPTNTPTAPQGKGCLNVGKIGCAIVIFLFFGAKKCVEGIKSTFSLDNADIEVVYDTARYDFTDDTEEYVIEGEPMDSITFDDIY